MSCGAGTSKRSSSSWMRSMFPAVSRSTIRAGDSTKVTFMTTAPSSSRTSCRNGCSDSDKLSSDTLRGV
jgi:hypothetical protein